MQCTRELEGEEGKKGREGKGVTYFEFSLLATLIRVINEWNSLPKSIVHSNSQYF